MAVEFIVESNRVAAPVDLRDPSNALLRSWGDPECTVAVEDPGSNGDITFSCGDEALVIATIDPSDPDHRCWAVFSAGALRTPESIFLAALLSALAATTWGGEVLDESNILGKGRQPNASDILESLQRSVQSNGSMFAASTALFGHLFQNIE